MCRLLVLIALLSATLVGGCAAERPKPPPAPADRVEEIRGLGTIAILPVDIEITQINAVGDNQRVPKLERRWTAGLVEDIASVVQARGFAVRIVSADSADLAAFRAFLKRVDGAGEPKATFGEAARTLATATQADGLLFVYFAGYSKSSGLKAQDAVLGIARAALIGAMWVAPADGGVLTATLLQGTTGDVLWMRSIQAERAPGAGAVNRLPTNPRLATFVAISSLPNRASPEDRVQSH